MFAVLLLSALSASMLRAQPRALIGSLDPRFFPPTATGVSDAVIDRRGQILVAGTFESFERARAGGLVVQTANGWRGVAQDVISAASLARDPEGVAYAWVSDGYEEDDYYIGRWNGEAWSHFAPSPPYGVRDMAAASDEGLYIATWYSTRWGSTGDGVVTWDGSQWRRLPGTPDAVNDLERDRDGTLYALWDNAIHRWHPTSGTWSIVVPDSPPFLVNQFTVAEGGEIYASVYNPDSVHYYATRWSGTGWQFLGQPSSDDAWIVSIHLTDDGSLYRAEQASEVASTTISRWDGAQWRPFVDGAGNRVLQLRGLRSHSGRLIGIGSFSLASGMHEIAQFDGHSWNALVESGLEIRAQSVSELVEGPNGDVFALGDLAMAGSTPVKEVARWDGERWKNLDPPIPGTQTIAVDPQGTLYAGGNFGFRFTDVGFEHGDGPYTNVQVYRNGAWEPFPAFVCDGELQAPVEIGAMTFARSDGTFYAGGSCQRSYHSNRHQVVGRWNGSTWEIIGRLPGPTESPFTRILELTTAPDGYLYVGGDFDAINGMPASGIARWDGWQWHALGEGLRAPYTRFSGIPYRIHPWHGYIVAAGAFERAGRVDAANMAGYIFERWYPLSSPFYGGRVYSLVTGKDGQLYASGQGGDMEDCFVARYDGRGWERIVEGFQNPPFLAFDGDGGLLMEDDTDGTERWLDADSPVGRKTAALYRFHIFPNPTSDRATVGIRTMESGPISIALYDALGRHLSTVAEKDAVAGELFTVDLVLTPFPSGAYYVRITSANGSSARPVVRL